MMILILILSIALNALLLWYTSKMINKLVFLQESTETILSTNRTFVEHLNDVNQMEMYFGDQTLVKLLEHSKFVVEQVEIYNEIFEELEADEDEDEEAEKERQ
jgi:hypothetical protein